MRDEKKATRQSYGEALLELGKENEKVVVFDDAFCYDSKNEEPNFDNKDVSIMDI